MSNAVRKIGFPAGAALFVVVLRVAIGWHFFYEGYDKYTSYGPGRTPFTAEHYLHAAQGPLRPFFTQLLPDANGFDRISDLHASDRIADLHSAAVAHYRMDAEQQEFLKKQRDNYQAKAKRVFDDPEFQTRLKDYKEFIMRVEQDDARINGRLAGVNPDGPDGGMFPVERLDENQGRINTIRNQLIAEMNVPIADYERKVEQTLTAKQKAMGPPMAKQKPMYWIDTGMTYGLLAVGASLMLGVFTRLGCLGGIAMLAMFYLSMPPWPGLVESPNVEGHYLFVNKNLIELLALVMILTTASGQWFGFDGLIRGVWNGWILRRGSAPPRVSPEMAAANRAASEKVQGRIQSNQKPHATPAST
jgi:uncharacterized membrane protein YphA (DoxX/SURF4 family)